MQGQRAAAEVMEALARLERHPEVDVIVVARGGGSVEDLLPFSDEALVRAVHQLRTPVVSAIGHEQDSPLLDLVADVRASTPTDAAKLVVPDVTEELRLVDSARHRLRQVLGGWLHARAGRPRRAALPPGAGRPPRAARRARRRGPRAARPRPPYRSATGSTAPRTTSPTSAPGPGRCRPLATLERGYAVLQDADGHVVTSVTGLAAKSTISVRVADGRVHATTTRTELLEESTDD